MNNRNLERTTGGFVDGIRRALPESQVIEEKDGKCSDLLYNARISFCRPECRGDIGTRRRLTQHSTSPCSYVSQSHQLQRCG